MQGQDVGLIDKWCYYKIFLFVYDSLKNKPPIKVFFRHQGLLYFILLVMRGYFQGILDKSAGAVEDTECISAEG